MRFQNRMNEFSMKTSFRTNSPYTG